MQYTHPRSRSKWKSRRYRFRMYALLLFSLSLLAVGTFVVRAETLPEQPRETDVEPNHNCLMCHGDPEFKGWFRNGELVSLYVDITTREGFNSVPVYHVTLKPPAFKSSSQVSADAFFAGMDEIRQQVDAQRDDD